jgi:hypothetical protein
MEIYLHSILILAIEESEWSALLPNRSNPGEELPVTIEQEAWWTPEPIWIF